ncbi:MAG: hypothetical protein PWP23_3044 [Candidatus Sumerlaeota bacterium]|nr:hypothetical protein [Candidatus Sumerlaeota bacterium]
MFGIPDPAIWLAMICCIIGALICTVYGAMHWNSDSDSAVLEPDDVKWAEEEKKIDGEL